jgi:hypothetical protein
MNIFNTVRKSLQAPELVISETDIEAALTLLRTLPYRQDMPYQWDRNRFLTFVREAVGKNPRYGYCSKKINEHSLDGVEAVYDTLAELGTAIGVLKAWERIEG